MTSRASRTKSARRRGARLGQHFLVNPQVADAVAEAAEIKNNDTVVEVGPGKGILTRALLARGARVIAIEKDPMMIAVLMERFHKEIASKQLMLYEKDIRDFLTLNTKRRTLNASSYKVAANIPYYITGELVRLFLTAEKQPDILAFLVQKEVAERIVGNPEQRRGARSKKESILSLSVKAYGTPHYVKTVKAGNFSPPPSVDSAILSISDISRNNFNSKNPIIYDKTATRAKVQEKNFFALLHAGFGQKRKMLLGNLKRALPASHIKQMEQAWEELGLAKNVRAEDVPLEAWLSLSRKVF